MVVLLAMLLSGCRSPSATPTGSPSVDTEATGSPTGLAGDTAGLDTPSTGIATADTSTTSDTSDSGVEHIVLSGDCVLTVDNPLRAWCDLDTSRAAEVEVSFEAGSVSRVHPGEGSGTVHRVGLHRMPPDTDVHWEARVVGGDALVQGSFRTGLLPETVVPEVAVTGSWIEQEYLHVGPCEDDNVAMVTRSSDGEVLWYQPFEDGRFVALHHSDDDTVIGVSGDRFLQEFDWMGQPLLTVEEPASSGVSFHHDVTRWNGITYTLTHDERFSLGQLYRFDGIVGFDDQGSEVFRWHMGDHWRPRGPHPRHGADVNHANSLVVRDGVALMSFRHMHLVLAIRVDPAAVDVGAVLWSLEGYPAESFFGSDFELFDLDGSRATFQQQHDVRWLPDGRLSIYDNGIPEERLSRGIEVELDFSTGVATILQQYVLDEHCDFQGGSARTSTGDAVLTCAPAKRAVRFAEGTDAILWEAELTCPDDRATRVLPRLIPLP